MVAYKDINGVAVEMTAEEEAEHNKEVKLWEDGALDRAFKSLRETRNALLLETDWWGASDNTMTAEQTQYRQDLRDITNGLTTEEEVKTKMKLEDGKLINFPIKPS